MEPKGDDPEYGKPLPKVLKDPSLMDLWKFLIWGPQARAQDLTAHIHKRLLRGACMSGLATTKARSFVRG